MPYTLTLSKDTKFLLKSVLALVIFIGAIIVLAIWHNEIMTQNYLESLDKLTCPEVWEMMMSSQSYGIEEVDYYGDRCP